MSNIEPMGKEDNVRVAIRCRPLHERETINGDKKVVQMDQVSGQVIVHNTKAYGEKEKIFTFDTVFDAESKQVDVYNETARPIIEFVLEGYNGTIFAYGQTGTGKTYTMEGYAKPETRGIIPNSFAHIFGHIAKCEGEVRFLVRVSYLEIYNEEVRDILHKPSRNPPKLEIRERADIGVYVKDLQSFVVKNADEMDKLMTIGNQNRVVASTHMNDHSSRSHVIFSITIERSDLGPDKKQHVRMGKLHLVDLAGSERQSKTRAVGERFVEAVKINLSLSTLGNVISALVDGRSTHIPYRNSNLTRLLQDSLGGNSKTVMIANIGPSEYNCDETLNTLRYANRAKNIKNNARINEDPKDAMLREFQKEINELKILLEEASGSEGSGDESERTSPEHRRARYKRSESAGSLSPRTVAMMKADIEREKAKLMATKGLAEGERNHAQKELEKREEELKSAQQQQLELEMKLKELNSKVIHGGVNLLEQAEEQEKLLESSARELEKRKRSEGKLRQKLQKKEEEKLDIEEKYTTLQDEATSKTRMLKEVWKQFQHTKEEIADMKAEAQQEKEEMLAMIRAVKNEVKLQTLVINSYIPHEYQEQLEGVVQWQEETGDWHMPGIAYAGNNMRKQQSPEPDPKLSSYYDTTMAYLTYGVGPYEVHSLLSSTTSGSNPSMGRPKAARKQAGAASKPKKKEEKAPVEEYPKTRGLVSRQQRFA